MNYQYEIGQRVMWRGGFGTQVPKEAQIVGRAERSNAPIYDLDNGHWAYEYQLENLNVSLQHL